MGIKLSFESLVEAAVTLGAAALMTLAGFEMLGGVVAARAPSELAGRAAETRVAMPHVEASPAQAATNRG